MKIIMGEEKVIVRGMRPEENPWGAYQFPAPYKLSDSIVVSVHVTDDSIEHFCKETKRWFKSTDNGETWVEVDGSISAECGLSLQNGEKLFFPQTKGQNLEGFELTSLSYRTPATDMTEKAKEGTLPLPDGMTFNFNGEIIYGYLADRLPESLSEKYWLALRKSADGLKVTEEKSKLEWPYLTRVVFVKDGKKVMRSVFPHGRARLGPDGAIWISTYSGDGHIDPKTGLYSPYYSAQIFRSEDNGHTFKLHAHMGYPADGTAEYPYLSGGFSDNDFEFMPDGSIVWFMRSAWFGRTGYEWSPMYYCRSTDGGKTFTKPTKFSHTGIYPSLCSLADGTKLLCYARPGIFVTASLNDSGTEWSEPLVVMTPNDRSSLANEVPQTPTFHEWDGACNNPQLLALDDNSALIFYSDFYYPDDENVKRKSILCRKLTIER